MCDKIFQIIEVKSIEQDNEKTFILFCIDTVTLSDIKDKMRQLYLKNLNINLKFKIIINNAN